MTSDGGGSARVDACVWVVRLFRTRSAATAACKAGHVRIGEERAKPAQRVRVGDRVCVLTDGEERIVVVQGLIAKRVAAPIAVGCYIDETPTSPPPEVRPVDVTRERGLGRPTKRDRRMIEQLRGRSDH